MKLQTLLITLTHAAIAFVICTVIYNHHVIYGNWGSTSDILVAAFTGLICLATFLLLFVAWSTKDSWLKQSENQLAVAFMGTLIDLYHQSWLNHDSAYHISIYNELIVKKVGCDKYMSHDAICFMNDIFTIEKNEKRFTAQEVREIQVSYELNYINYKKSYETGHDLIDDLKLKSMKLGCHFISDSDGFNSDLHKICSGIDVKTTINKYAELLKLEKFKMLDLSPFKKYVPGKI